ncbi:MAG: oligosaccharyl transferase, archaeosortase A system-associated [Halobacteriales archaeon]|nr:oligosaccharyl transferase, archaeosortase A system-associated [Halobacteriales archaeon]
MKNSLTSSLSQTSLAHFIEKWCAEISLIFIFLFMLWIRMRAYSLYFFNHPYTGDQIYLAGNDPWYHLRMVTYTTHNWPFNMPFDPWTNFPYGTQVGQFGTLYDQIVATFALIIGVGSPSTELIMTVLIIAPAIIGSLTVLPTYLIAKHFGGKSGGIFAALLLALLPGVFLQRSIAGYSDHHVAEVFFQAIAILTLLIAITVFLDDKPVWEFVELKDFPKLKRSLIWGGLVGLTTLLYLLVWPPGLLLIGIFGIFFFVRSNMDHISGNTPDYIAFLGVVSMAFVGLALLLFVNIPYPEELTSVLNFRVTNISLLHSSMALSIAIGCAFLAWLSRFFSNNNLPKWGYPLTLLALLSFAALILYLILPYVFEILYNNITRTFGFNISAGTRTIEEANSFLSLADPAFGISWVDVIRREYGYAFFLAFAAPFFILKDYLNEKKYESGILLLLIWSILIGVSTFTQARFNYYLAIPVVVLNAYVLKCIFQQFNIDKLRSIKPYQFGVILVIFLVVLAPLAIPMQIGSDDNGPIHTSTAFEISMDVPLSEVYNWDPALQWMKLETPLVGNYGGSNNPLDYYGTVESNYLGINATGDFAYPDGAYGVMSWWDYGHWITLRAERIPVSNPFQEGAVVSANYLLSQSESESESILSTIDDGSGVRYIVLDWQIVSSGAKLHGPATFKEGVSVTNYQNYLIEPVPGGYGLRHILHPSSYYNSQMVRLYHYHGSSIAPTPLVIDWDTVPGLDPEYYKLSQTRPGDPDMFPVFDTIEDAQSFTQDNPTSQIGGIGTFPTEPIPALKHYRLVYATPNAIQISPYYVHTTSSWVKIFERVPGATITGTAPPNTPISGAVAMHVPTTNSTFRYIQHTASDASGKFTMVVPYSTIGYLGPQDGYTNVDVRAVGPYYITTEFGTYSGTVHVPDSSVNGIGPELTIDLEKDFFELCNCVWDSEIGTIKPKENTP